ncbi:hypothetical protein ACP70R_003803 [Stipagrostis hirtigluma subsp. patula]
MGRAKAHAAASRPWPDLPSDLLLDISRCLHAADDYVRFHAVCKPWRDTLPPAHCRPAFLPWLLAPLDAAGHRTARSVVFSSSKPSHGRARATAAVAMIRVPDRRWVVRADDGMATAWRYSYTAPSPDSGKLVVDALIGSEDTTLPLYPDEVRPWMEPAAGVVSSDGTIFIYAFYHSPNTSGSATFKVALLRPGDATWTLVQRTLGISVTDSRYRCCVAYHNGDIVVCCDERCWRIVARHINAAIGDRSYGWNSRNVISSYLVESRGELLWVFVQVNSTSPECQSVREFCATDIGSLACALSVSVFALQQVEGSEPHWVTRDNESMADRVLFLGPPSCFAMDAARIGMSGGCAYFLDKRRLCNEVRSRCRLFRYNFHDGESAFVEQLPDDWNHDACMWVTPQPAIHPTQETRERLEALNGKAAVHQQHSVSTATVSDQAPQEEEQATLLVGSRTGPRRGTRPRRKSVRMKGPEWA